MQGVANALLFAPTHEAPHLLGAAPEKSANFAESCGWHELYHSDSATQAYPWPQHVVAMTPFTLFPAHLPHEGEQSELRNLRVSPGLKGPAAFAEMARVIQIMAVVFIQVVVYVWDLFAVLR